MCKRTTFTYFMIFFCALFERVYYYGVYIIMYVIIHPILVHSLKELLYAIYIHLIPCDYPMWYQSNIMDRDEMKE